MCCVLSVIAYVVKRFVVSGPNVKTAVAILNCLLARQLCFEDAPCSAILEIIPRVCGSELGEYCSVS
jgi:hypothetical protein